MGLGFINKVVPQSLIKNLLAYYRLDGDALDYSGNGYNPDIIENITYDTGVVGQSAVWDGSDYSKIEVQGEPFTFTDGTNDLPFSVSFWLYWSGGDVWLISKRDGNISNIEWQIIIYNNGIGFNAFAENSGSKYLRKKASFENEENKWNHITVTYSGMNANDGVRLYLNGNEMAYTISDKSNYTQMSQTTSKLAIGNAIWETILNLNGKMQMIAIFGKELNQYEVMKLYQKQQNQFLK